MQREDLRKPTNPVRPSKPKIKSAAPSLFKAPQAPKKQPRSEEEAEEDESSSDYEHFALAAPGVNGAQDGDEDGEEDANDGGEVQVNFELQDPKEEDYHAIKQFLLNYLHGGKFNSSEMSDLILKEPIGSVIRIDGEDTYGFVTIVSLHAHKDLECVKQLKRWMLQKVRDRDANAATALQTLFEDSGRSLGLLLNERMVNVPLELAHPLHRTAFEEVEIAADDDKAKWDFENIVLLSSFYQEAKTSDQQQKGPQKKKKRREWSEEISYHKPEEECYAKAASISVTFPMKENAESPARWTLMNFVKDTAQLLVIPRENIPRVLAEMQAMSG